MTLPAVNRQIAVAVLLARVWAAIMGLLTLLFAIPALSSGASQAVALLLPAALSVTGAVSAHGLRRRKWPFFALGAASAWIAFLVTSPLSAKIAMPGVVLNAVVLGLVLTNMRQFR